jgi:hypothetical protein
MKRTGVVFLIMVIGFATLGMGGLGNQATIETPEPDRNYSALLVDQSDVSMRLEKLSYNGQTFITGEMGRARLSIDFRKISAILFYLEDDKVRAEITLADGKETELYLEKDIPWFGSSAFADVRIENKDIKKIGPLAFDPN